MGIFAACRTTTTVLMSGHPEVKYYLLTVSLTIMMMMMMMMMMMRMNRFYCASLQMQFGLKSHDKIISSFISKLQQPVRYSILNGGGCGITLSESCILFLV